MKSDGDIGWSSRMYFDLEDAIDQTERLCDGVVASEIRAHLSIPCSDYTKHDAKIQIKVSKRKIY